MYDIRSTLEIGPGKIRNEGFLRYGAATSPGGVDVAGDARRLPWPARTFALVYSSHCLEHIEWYEVEDTVAEWARVVAPGGALEIHTVDASKLLPLLLDPARLADVKPGTWRANLHRHRPYEWIAGRLLNYRAKGPGGHLQLHRALITRDYLQSCMEKAGLVVDAVPPTPRGKDHGWINLGMRGVKPC